MAMMVGMGLHGGPEALEVGTNKVCMIWNPGHPPPPTSVWACVIPVGLRWQEVASGQPGLEDLRGIWNFPHPAHSPSSGVRWAKWGVGGLPY